MYIAIIYFDVWIVPYLSSGSPSSWLLCLFLTCHCLFITLSCFLAFWYKKVLQTDWELFSLVLEPAISLRSLVPFRSEWYLESSFCGYIAFGVSRFTCSLIYMHFYIFLYVHICIPLLTVYLSSLTPPGLWRSSCSPKWRRSSHSTELWFLMPDHCCCCHLNGWHSHLLGLLHPVLGYIFSILVRTFTILNPTSWL